MNEAAEQRMAMISPESHRWRSFILAGRITDQIQAQLINVPTPRLVNFNIVRSYVAVREMPLALEGASLRELTLAWCAVDWESSRLRALRCLRLHRQETKAPTVKQLHAILSASPNLEILDLAYWDYGHLDQPQNETLGTVFLPSLATLAVEAVPPIVLRTLLSCIQSPNYKYIRLTSIDQACYLSSYQREELANLLPGPLSTVSRLLLSYDQATGSCTLTHRETELPPQPNIRESSIKLARRRGVYLRTAPVFNPFLKPEAARLYEMRLRKFIQEIIQPALYGLQVPTQLELHHRWPRVTDTPTSPPISVARDLLLNLPLVTHLRIRWCFEPIEIIRFLSVRQPIRKMDGEVEQGLAWPVPLLDTLTVACSVLIADQPPILEALNELISKRNSYPHHAGASGAAYGKADDPECEDSHPPGGLKRIVMHSGLEKPFKMWDIENGWREV
ncbi:hypothetical protein FRC04_009208 [Tulasnella sp. 424]|nr:hypothetical protein FRC04_009208 [Tulasnella sp. 424]KAG8973562.1 hypothetical protein FRC05_008630 [Tulasnella sp. 425]